MKRWVMILVPAVAAAALVGEAVTVPEAAKAASCTAKWEVTWKKVAVRKPAANQLVARPDSRVVRYLYRGDVVTSCYAAVARTESGPAYTKCGRGGNLWQIVRGGQVPQTCLKRV